MRRNVYFYTQLDIPFVDAVPGLGADPGLWLPAGTVPAGQGWQVPLDAGGALPRALARRPALVELDALARRADRAWRRLQWRALDADRHLPALRADLELEALVDDSCRLSLVGSYEPPGALVGSMADTAVGHRVAEAAVRRLVLDVGAALQRDRDHSNPAGILTA